MGSTRRSETGQRGSELRLATAAEITSKHRARPAEDAQLARSPCHQPASARPRPLSRRRARPTGIAVSYARPTASGGSPERSCRSLASARCAPADARRARRSCCSSSSTSSCLRATASRLRSRLASRSRHRSLSMVMVSRSLRRSMARSASACSCSRMRACRSSGVGRVGLHGWVSVGGRRGLPRRSYSVDAPRKASRRDRRRRSRWATPLDA